MKIVLVEPNPVEQSTIRSALTERKEEVFAFDNGNDAWAFVEQTSDVDIIITALDLEGISGLELCWNARILAEHRNAMYVIAMSEEQDSGNLVEALDAGADDYLQKPLHHETLLARLRVAERVVTLQTQLMQLAHHDPLTNMFNRRAFFKSGNQLLETSKQALCAIMFDIDHFKRVNDAHGHDVGDQVIKTVAQIALDQGVTTGRLGGEEFAMLIEGHSLLSAARIADHLRLTIQDSRIDVGGAKPLRITSSFGVSLHREGDSLESLLRRADLALYTSKNMGRNLVTVEQPDHSMLEIASDRLHIRQKSRA